jgi:molybdopterin adenylyltransferase
VKFKVESINISKKKGVIKEPVTKAEFNSLGIVGDAHAGRWHRQVSLLSQESVDGFIAETGMDIKHGEFAENLTISGIDFKKIKKLDRFLINGITLVVTQIGKKCHGDNCAIYSTVGKCIMPTEGIFSKVVSVGKISVGDDGEYLPKVFKIKVITLSDRASKGEYEDISGVVIVDTVKEWFETKGRHLEIDKIVIPDEEDLLTSTMNEALDKNVDIIITTGGTGVGPRDITPDVIGKMAHKMLPGIMDHVRIKHGDRIPNALLSRSIACVIDKTSVYVLPGSVKAVKEYMAEILKSMEHLVEMLHDLGHN